MDKHFKMVYLLDIYGGLLTERQQSYLDMYYNEDLSLSEIASREGVSRQAVSDLIKRSEKILDEYDDKLMLFDKYLKNIQTIDRIKATLGDERHSEILKMLDGLRDDL